MRTHALLAVLALLFAFQPAFSAEPPASWFEVRQQSRGNWRPEFSATAVNQWIREGFGIKKLAAVPQCCQQAWAGAVA